MLQFSPQLFFKRQRRLASLASVLALTATLAASQSFAAVVEKKHVKSEGGAGVPIVPSAGTGSNLVDRPRRELFTALKVDELSPPTRELAESLEVLPLLRELNDAKDHLSLERKTEIREQIIETVLESYFDVAAIQGEAEKERGGLEALRQVLMDKRDKGIETNNAINFMASGTLNTIGSVLGFSTTAPPFPGNFNQMMSGVVSTGMSMYSLKQGAGGKAKAEGNSTVISELFGRPINKRTTWPESVWRFLHSRSLDHPDRTRIEVLEDYWISRQWLEPHGSKKEKRKIDMVCGVEEARRAVSIDDLSDQINIINDISATTSLMAHHLRDILRMVDSDVIK
jgi:hypothetical protein